VRKEIGRWKSWWRIWDLPADERCSQAVLDFLVGGYDLADILHLRGQCRDPQRLGRCDLSLWSKALNGTRVVGTVQF